MIAREIVIYFLIENTTKNIKLRFAKYTAVDFSRIFMLKKLLSKINVWSLYYRTEIVWFSIGFIIGAIII